jgi:peptidoglycan/xylan/chitin deacetylase (PgdA/CDA1 family)
MAYLKSNGYNIIPLSEAVAYIRDKRHPPDKTVAITIDDGYENNYRYAYPVLKRYKIPATIFVVVDFVGKKGFLSWGELKELSASGLVDVESHTMSHPWLQYIEAGRLKYELEESKTILENRLGKKVRFICYPMGGYNENVKATARAAGYEAGFATKPTRLSPNYDIYEIKRVRISKTADNLLVFRIKVSGYHSFWRILQADYREIPYILWRKRSL